MKAGCLSIFALCLMACASDPRDTWWKEGFSIEQFGQDSAWCMERAQIVASSMPIRTFADGAAKRKRVKEFHYYCLKMKGYHPVEDENGAPPLYPLTPSEPVRMDVCDNCRPESGPLI